MDKILNAVGLMSGTSMDGIDASIIRSDGENNVDIVGNLYLKYDSELKNSLHQLCYKINSLNDLKKNIKEFKTLERIITIKHSEIALKICKKFNFKPRIIGFHGQTILHKPKEKYSIQMGNAQLLSQLLKKDVIYNFRKKDIENGGDGAPLAPIFHKFIKKKITSYAHQEFNQEKFTNIENINIVNDRLNTTNAKKAGWSIGLGFGYGINLNNQQVINWGPSIGIGVVYSPKWLRF